jgi:hypothetical protein
MIDWTASVSCLDQVQKSLILPNPLVPSAIFLINFAETCREYLPKMVKMEFYFFVLFLKEIQSKISIYIKKLMRLFLTVRIFHCLRLTRFF